MKKNVLLVITGILYSFIISSQDKIYFPYFEVMNMHHEYQYSASKLFKTYIENYHNYVVVLPEMKDSVYPRETHQEINQKAKTLGTDFFMTGDINVMGTTAIVSVTLYETETGTRVWQDMLKASSPDDLDPVILRLAKAVGTDSKASARGDIYSVSGYESEQLNKISAQYNWGIFIGGMYNFYTGIENNFSAGFGITFSYDIRNVILNLNGDLFFGDITHYDFNLTTLVPLSENPVTPFVGAGLGYGGSGIENDDTSINNSGLILFLRGGYIVNRTSSVHMKATGSLFAPAYKINNQIPMGVMLTVSFLF